MRPCDVHGCGYTYPSVGELTAHRILDHDALPSTALVCARRAFGLETLAPERLSFLGAAERIADVIETHLATAPKIKQKRLREAASTVIAERRIHRSKSHAKDPASCVYCARFAPEKCRRHGGPSHSTSFTGDRTDQAAYVAWRDKIRPLWKIRQQLIRTQKRAAVVMV